MTGRFQPGAVVIWERRFGYRSEHWLCQILKINQESYRVRALKEGAVIERTVLRWNIVRQASLNETTKFRNMLHGNSGAAG